MKIEKNENKMKIEKNEKKKENWKKMKIEKIRKKWKLKKKRKMKILVIFFGKKVGIFFQFCFFNFKNNSKNSSRNLRLFCKTCRLI